MKRITIILTLLLGLMSPVFAELAYNTTLTESDFNNSSTKVGVEGTIEWDNGNIRCGGSSTSILPGSPGYNYDDKYVDIHIANGVPDKLTFQYATNSAAATGVSWFVKESADGNAWSSEKWTSTTGGTTFHDASVNLSPTTRYLRFCYSGNFAGYFKDIKVTEKITMNAPNPAVIDFGTVHVDDEVAVRTFTVNWTNLTATVTSSDAHVTVTPTTFGSIGGNNQTTTFTVSIATNEAYTTSATLTLSGRNKTQTVTVTATVQKYDQTVSWTQAESIETDAVIALPTSTSGLTNFTYTISDPTVLKFEAGSFTILKSGTVTVTPTQPGNYKYNSAVGPTKTLIISKATPAITKQPTATQITYPAPLSQSTLSGGTASVAGTFAWVADPTTVYKPGTYNEAVIFRPTDKNRYNNVNLTVPLKILPPTTHGEVYAGTCPGTNYYYAGNYYAPRTSPYTVTLRNYLGGDSIVTLHVAEYPTYNEIRDVTIYSDQTFLWNCDTYTQSGVYTHTYISRHGCDSTVTIRLTVLPKTTYGEVSGEICHGERFNYHGKYYTAGTYQETLVNHLGGDSVVTITVTEYPTYNETINVSLCSGQTFLWDCDQYKTSGRYTKHYTTVNGCDSTVTLNLTVLKSYTIPQSRTIGMGWAETWRGQDLSVYTSGEHVLYDSLTSSQGCDSVYVLNLTVIAQGPTTYRYDSAYVCPGESYSYMDTLISNLGTYVFKLRNSQYGDSIVTFYLRHWPTYKSKSNRVIHQGVDYLWRGQQLSIYDEGSYVLWDSLQSVHGCDSLFYCTLTVLAPETQYNDIYASICPGDTLFFEGRQFTDSGTYRVPAAEQSRYRGDSINRIHLAFYPTYLSDRRRIMYEGQNAYWHDHNLSRFPVGDTVIYDSLKTRNGCDSVFRLRLTVLEVPTTYYNDTILLCGRESVYRFRDTVIATPGDYVFHLINYLGGDSVVSLHVDKHDTYLVPYYDTIMQGTTYRWRGRTLILKPYDHVITDTLQTIYGCDSLHRLYLHVNPCQYLLYDTMEVCQNSVHTWHGKRVRTDSLCYLHEYPGMADTFASSYSSDSVRVLRLTVNPAPVVHFYETWRQGKPRTWYVEHFSTLSPGFYTFTSGRLLHTHQGCDSMEVMHLAVVPTVRVNQVVNLCPGESITIDGKSYNRKGVYTVNTTYIYHGYDHLNLDSLGFAGRTFYGDSIITLTVNERPNYNLTIEKHLEYGDVLWFKGEAQVLDWIGTRVYYDTTQSIYGCDSLTTLYVYVDRARQTITWNPDMLSVHAGDSILLYASASSGLPVTFTSSSLFYAAVNEGGWLIGRVMGRATITASQSGNTYYYAAPPVQYTFDILEPLPYDDLEAVRPDEDDVLPEGASPVKVIRNGHLYILTPRGVFDASGRQVEK